MRVTSYGRTGVTVRSTDSLPICVADTFADELFWRKKRKNEASLLYSHPLIGCSCLSGGRS